MSATPESDAKADIPEVRSGRSGHPFLAFFKSLEPPRALDALIAEIR
jgi:hypothetical protein